MGGPIWQLVEELKSFSSNGGEEVLQPVGEVSKYKRKYYHNSCNRLEL